MMLPEMKIPTIHSYDQIVALAREKVAAGKKPRSAVLTDSDPDTLKAVASAAADGLIEPIIIGSRETFASVASKAGLSLTPCGFQTVKKGVTPADVAIGMAGKGEIDLIVDARSATQGMLPMITSGASEFVSPGRIASHVAVLKPKRYKKLLLVSDGMVVPEPDIRGKMAVIENLVRVSEAIGIEKPRIAVLAAVEVVYPQMPVTLDAAVLSKMADRKQIKGAWVDGPLSFDVAVDMEAAHSKGITASEVAGQTDSMLAPNIEVASGIYLAMTLYGNCACGGVIVGGRVPVAVNARMDSPQNRYNSIILGVLTA